MDQRLVAWGRAVKSRRRRGWPPLWLFSDAGRAPDVAAAVLGLPRGLCGVVVRHDGVDGRAELIQSLWRLCRSRRVAMVVAGVGAVPAGAGRHVRAARGAIPRLGRGGWTTASAHGVADLVRARRRRIDLVFLSPAFATPSHPGAPGLRPLRWAAMARRAGVPVAALGGVTGRSVARLGGRVAAAGAIGALGLR